MQIDVLTLFPELVEQVVRQGMPRWAVEQGALQLTLRQIRDFSADRNRRVDERPYGGGPGMVMQPEPLAKALEAAKQAAQARGGSAKVVLMSPQGEPLTQDWLRRLSVESNVVLLCGRYEGIDERIAGQVDLELSIGDYVLSGGELAAMVIIDGIARLLPGVLGHEQSAEQDSFSAGLLDHPHYTRPDNWRGKAVPEVLLCGDHAKVALWRLQQALGRTWLRRPDLLENLQLTQEQTRLLREFIVQEGEERQT